ncbi:MAG: acetyl-CoA acetyltransferase [Acidimicrobiia bacterium]
MIDPRTPVIVGVGQLNRRPGEAELPDATEPVAMMAEVVRAAAADAGVGDTLLSRMTGVRVMRVTEWHYADAAGLLASTLGIAPPDREVSGLGGNSVQRLLTEAADAIQRGEHDAVVLCGAEAAHSVALARKVGFALPWMPDTPTADDAPPSPRHPAEDAAGLRSVREFFPLLDNAIRGRTGATIPEHTARIGRMWSNYSLVAAANPYAWSPRVRTPDEITTVTADNRMICFPYTKVMNAYARVDQAAAVIVCSVEVARALGIGEDRWVFPLAGATCHEHWFVSERDDLGVSVGMRANADAVLGAAQVDIDDVRHLDLYACFPAPPQLAADALGVPVDDPERPLTCTGGLAFAGGPGNSYMTHAIANVVGRLREEPGSLGLASGVGWYATTHSAGLYGTRPPADGFRRVDPQAVVDAGARRAVAEGYEGTGTLETYTVSHDRDGAPERAFLAVLTPDGARAWASSTDLDLMVALETEELLGTEIVFGRSVGP